MTINYNHSYNIKLQDAIESILTKYFSEAETTGVTISMAATELRALVLSELATRGIMTDMETNVVNTTTVCEGVVESNPEDVIGVSSASFGAEFNRIVSDTLKHTVEFKRNKIEIFDKPEI